ncbi:MAG: hypothetical protein WC655_26125 [Candidatus Hydrogenedentales bacterium]|jgi:hypothetical protein
MKNATRSVLLPSFLLLVVCAGMTNSAVANASEEDDVSQNSTPPDLPPQAAHLHAQRFAENPIIRPEMLPNGDGKNINGPTLIRVPDWIAEPLGKYYLYFADHGGAYIRLAYADVLAGPWKIHTPGSLRLEQAPDGRRHIASPDVLVDAERNELRMYFHCPSKSTGEQMTYVARSTDGIRFVAGATPLGPSYFRVFRYEGYWYAMAKPGTLYRSLDGLTPFEVGPNAFAGVKGCNEGNTRIRHVALDLVENVLNVYWTNIGDRPESILHASIALNADWTEWKASPPELLLKPQEPYEGADLPLLASQGAKSTARENAVRDPGIFKEEGRTYLLYSVAGEAGIAIAELIAGKP